MRQINETFDDAEYERLRMVKGERTWHDFIMLLAQPVRKPTARPTDAKLPK